MTQTALIARLENIAEAFERIEDGGGVQGEVATAALAGLRELIKEAEGQEETAYMFPDGFVARPDNMQFCQHRSGQIVRLLYTALGEPK